MTQFPGRDDVSMQELNAFEKQLNALIRPLFSEYHTPKMHEIGQTLKQARLLAHDVEYFCGMLYDQYERACYERESAAEVEP